MCRQQSGQHFQHVHPCEHVHLPWPQFSNAQARAMICLIERLAMHSARQAMWCLEPCLCRIPHCLLPLWCAASGLHQHAGPHRLRWLVHRMHSAANQLYTRVHVQPSSRALGTVPEIQHGRVRSALCRPFQHTSQDSGPRPGNLLEEL